MRNGLAHTDLPIVIYRRADAGANWYFRWTIGKCRRPISARTLDLENAKTIALRSYFENEAKHSSGLSLTTHSVERAFGDLSKWIDDQVALRKSVRDRQGITKKDGEQKKAILRRYFLTFFAKSKLGDIGAPEMQAFWEWRYRYWVDGPGANEKEQNPLFRRYGEPNRNTLIVEGQTIALLFRHAISAGYILAGPPTAPPKSMGRFGDPYPYFEQDELNSLLKFVHLSVAKAKRPDVRFANARWLGVLNFAAYSGCDPSEIWSLKLDKLSRLKFENDGVDQHHFSALVSGKRTRTIGEDKVRSVVILPEATVWVEEWLDFRRQWFFANDDGYVFPNPDGSKVTSGSVLFKRLLKKWNTSVDPKSGREWTLYSMRHTFRTLAINIRISTGIFWRV